MVLQNMFTLKQVATVGRGEDNDLIILEDYISRKHFSLLGTEQGEYLLQIDSKNGLLLNGDSQKEGICSVKNGDEIEVGDYTFIFQNRASREYADTFDYRYLSHLKQDQQFYFLQLIHQRKSHFYLFRRDLKTFFQGVKIIAEPPFIQVDQKPFEHDLLPAKGQYLDIKYHLFTSEQACHIFQHRSFYGFSSISSSMIAQYFQIWVAAHSNFSMFIHGETGTGKDVMAHAIHKISERSGKFVAINCASIPDNLWESELFGHVKGSYTGAESAREGAFQAAHEGTLFLDEIADMPLDQQAKLLRVLETKKVRKLGSDKEERVDVRILCATHKDIFKLVQSGDFREDLLHRIYVMPVKLLPLRDRIEDIPLYVSLFLRDLNDKMGFDREISPTAMDHLQGYLWPGNVRELKHTLERAYLMADDGTIRREHLFFFNWKTNTPRTLEEIVDQAILDVLVKHKFNRKRSYEELQISRSKLYRWMEEHTTLLKGFDYE